MRSIESTLSFELSALQLFAGQLAATRINPRGVERGRPGPPLPAKSFRPSSLPAARSARSPSTTRCTGRRRRPVGTPPAPPFRAPASFSRGLKGNGRVFAWRALCQPAVHRQVLAEEHDAGAAEQPLHSTDSSAGPGVFCVLPEMAGTSLRSLSKISSTNLSTDVSGTKTVSKSLSWSGSRSVFAGATDGHSFLYVPLFLF